MPGSERPITAQLWGCMVQWLNDFFCGLAQCKAKSPMRLPFQVGLLLTGNSLASAGRESPPACNVLSCHSSASGPCDASDGIFLQASTSSPYFAVLHADLHPTGRTGCKVTIFIKCEKLSHTQLRTSSHVMPQPPITTVIRGVEPWLSSLFTCCSGCYCKRIQVTDETTCEP